MPPRKKKPENTLEQARKESAEHAKLIREEFGRMESDLIERYRQENESERIKGLRSIMNAKLRLLRYQIYVEMDMITGDYVHAVREAEKKPGRAQRVKGISERLASSSGRRPATRNGNGEKNDAGKDDPGENDDAGENDESQDDGQPVSQITTGETTRNRTRMDNSADEAQNGSNQTAVGSAAAAASLFPVLPPVPIVMSDAVEAPVSDANAVPDSSAGPPATSASDSVMESVVDSVVGSRVACGARSAADPAAVSTAASSARPVTRSLADSVADSGAGSVDPSIAKKSDRSKREDTVVVQSIEATASQPRATETVIKTGRRTIKIKGPTPPSSHGTQDAGHEPSRQDGEIDPGDPISEHKKPRKKRKSKATKNRSLLQQIFESDPSDNSTENKESAKADKQKKNSKKKEDESMSMPSKVVYVEPNKESNNKEDASKGTKKKSKAAKENNPTPYDVIEIASSAEEIEPDEPQIAKRDQATPDDGNNIDREKKIEEEESAVNPTTAGGEETSPAPEEPRPPETEQRAPELEVRRSKRTRKPSQRKLEADTYQRGSRRR